MLIYECHRSIKYLRMYNNETFIGMEYQDFQDLIFSKLQKIRDCLGMLRISRKIMILSSVLNCQFNNHLENILFISGLNDWR